MIYLSHNELSKLLGLPTYEEWEKMTNEEKDKLIESRKKGTNNEQVNVSRK